MLSGNKQSICYLYLLVEEVLLVLFQSSVNFQIVKLL